MEAEQKEEIGSVEDLKKPGSEWFPGKINMVTRNTAESGVKCKLFSSDEEMNYFAEKNRQFLFVDVQAGPNGSILAFYTATHSKERHDQLARIQTKAQELLAAEDEVIEAQKKEQELRDYEVRKEREELYQLGMKCRANHGAVIEENAAMKKELKKLKRGK